MANIEDILARFRQPQDAATTKTASEKSIDSILARFKGQEQQPEPDVVAKEPADLEPILSKFRQPETEPQESPQVQALMDKSMPSKQTLLKRGGTPSTTPPSSLTPLGEGVPAAPTSSADAKFAEWKNRTRAALQSDPNDAKARKDWDWIRRWEDQSIGIAKQIGEEEAEASRLGAGYQVIKPIGAGLTFGLSNIALDRAEKSLGVEGAGVAETRAGQFAQAGLQLAGGVASGQVLSSKLAGVKGLKNLSPLKQALALRTSVGAIQGAANAISNYATDQRTASEAVGDVAQAIFSSAISVIPEATISNKIANGIMQVVTDFATDLIIDAGLRDRLEDQSFKEWFINEELINLIPSIVGASSDIKDKDFAAKQRAMRQDLDASIRRVKSWGQGEEIQPTPSIPGEKLPLPAPEELTPELVEESAGIPAEERPATATVDMADQPYPSIRQEANGRGLVQKGENATKSELIERIEMDDAKQELNRGVGAASPEEFGAVNKFTQRSTKSAIDEERARNGMEAIEQPVRQTWGAEYDKAKQRIDDEPQWQDNLIAEMLATPRPATEQERAAMLQRRIDLMNKRDQAWLRQEQARDAGFSERADAEDDNLARINSQIEDVDIAMRQSGTAAGRALAAIKMTMDQDFSLVKMEREMRAAKGSNLSAEDVKQLELFKQKHDEIGKKIEEVQQAERMDGVDESIRRSSKPKAKDEKTTIEDAQDAIATIKGKLEDGNGDDIYSQVQDLVKFHVEQGVKNRGELINAVHRDLMNIRDAEGNPLYKGGTGDTIDLIAGYGRFKPLSQDEVSTTIRDLKGQLLRVSKLISIKSKGEAPKKTGVERPKETDEQRRLTKAVNEAKRKYGVETTDPERQLQGALEARKTAMRNQISDLEWQITNRQKILKETTPARTDQELLDLTAKRNELKAEFVAIFGDPKLSPENQLKRAIASAEKMATYWDEKLKLAKRGVFKVAKPKDSDLWSPELGELRKSAYDAKQEVEWLKKQSMPDPLVKAAERRMKAWEERLAKAKQGLFEQKVRVKKPTQPEIEAMNAKSEAMRAEVDALRKMYSSKWTPNDVATARLNAAITASIADYQDRIAKNQFDPKPRKQTKYNEETLKLMAQREQVRHDFNRAKFDYMLANRRPVKKVFDTISGLSNILRAVRSSFDLSAILNQGGWAVVSRPGIAMKALSKSFKAIKNDFEAELVNTEINNRPNAPLYRQAGLALTKRGESLHKMEEAFQSRFANKIPGIGASERIYSAFLNQLRADMFDSFASTMSRSGTPTVEEAKAIATYINEATGRGGLGKLESASVGLAAVLWSPRRTISRFQMLAGHSLWGGSARTRKLITKEYARFATGIGLTYMLAELAGASIEKDPKSADFGKIRIGNTRIDPLSGLSQVITLAHRVGSGFTKRADGTYHPVEAEKAVGNFLMNKVSPPISMVRNFLKAKEGGRDFEGRTMTYGKAIKEMLPISFGDIAEAMQEWGIARGTAISILGILGAGVNIYETKKSTREPKSFEKDYKLAKEAKRISTELNKLMDAGMAEEEAYRYAESQTNDPDTINKLYDMIQRRSKAE